MRLETTANLVDAYLLKDIGIEPKERVEQEFRLRKKNSLQAKTLGTNS